MSHQSVYGGLVEQARTEMLQEIVKTMAKSGAARGLRDERAAFAELARYEDLVGGPRKLGHVLRDQGFPRIRSLQRVPGGLQMVAAQDRRKHHFVRQSELRA